MKYILKEIESEEEFVEVFGRRSGWALFPTTLNKSADRHKEAPSTPNHSRDNKSGPSFSRLFFWRRKC